LHVESIIVLKDLEKMVNSEKGRPMGFLEREVKENCERKEEMI